MRVVIAPDKFAGTMTAAQAATAIARGWASERPRDELWILPMADGGEGLLDVVSAAVPCERRRTVVSGPLGARVEAAWLMLGDGRGVIEAAETIGRHLVPTSDRNPLRATSSGLGELLVTAAATGCREIVIGLGGSVTVDGGAGMAVELGAILADRAGRALEDLPASLLDLERVTAPTVPLPPVTVAVDVDNPLLGPQGAARMYGPQKGAQPSDVDMLESALQHFADVVERDVDGGPWRAVPGAGAAGGLGFALMAMVGAKVSPGGAVVADLIGLRDAVAAADVVVTGEGSLDAQTLRGKAPDHVRRAARAAGAAVAAIAGRAHPSVVGDFDAVEELGEQGLQRPEELTQHRAAALARRLSLWAPATRP